MAELFNKYSRLSFPKNEQKQFINDAKLKLKLTNNDLASLLNISVRTLTDWKREKYLISSEATKILSLQANLQIPSKIKELPAFWSVKKAAKLGAAATIKKYGRLCTNEEKRKAGWKKWWQSKGRKLTNLPIHPKKVFYPKKSTKLSEFVGIMIGDGSITDYQFAVSLNKITDKLYAQFVCQIIEELFQLKPSKNYYQSVVDIRVSRKNLIKFLLRLGLLKGNKIKQGVDIPLWIKDNPKYSLACLRGLIDTDGCLYLHRYKSKGNNYYYRKISFSSRSDNLIKSVKRILENIGIHPIIDSRGEIRVYNINEVKLYFKKVGSSNPKHIKKFNEMYGEVA